MLWTLLGILLTASTVQAQVVSDWDRFRLFNACRPMMLAVEGRPPDAQAVGLTEERIQLAAESRLRAAQRYTESGEKANYATLYTLVSSVVSPSFNRHAANITVEYHKLVTDLATNSNALAPTWKTGRTGVGGGDANFISFGPVSWTNSWLNYLRVNDPACNTR